MDTDVLLIVLVVVSSWFVNVKNVPRYVAIPIESDIVQLYKIDDKYQCPDYCGIKHIHKIHSDSKPLTFDKKTKIKIYLQK